MERSRLLVALSVLLLASTATAANAQALSGTVLLRHTSGREIPGGVNEVGRFARFIGDDRMLDRYEMQLRNRDYEHWKPLEASSRQRMMHYMAGQLRMYHPTVTDQSVGRFQRFVWNDTMAYNNALFDNRDYENFYVNGPTSRSGVGHYVRGLAAGANLMPVFHGYYPTAVGLTNPLGWF